MNKNGFTLIELMIVMAIMALLMGLVGPLTINSVEKSQAKLEVVTLLNWLDDLSYRAFLTQQSITLELHGKEAVAIDQNEQIIKSVSFENLFFQPQQVSFNRNGFSTQKQFSYQLNEKTIAVPMSGFTYEQ